MGLLDEVIGGVMGNAGASGSPLQNVLMNMLGGSQAMPSQGMGGIGSGGLGSLISKFEQAGLGHIAQSWVGTGPNLPVSPQQLQSVFGGDQVQAMARQSGMAAPDFLSQLSQHLPRVVDGLTPNGRLPNEGTVSV